MRKLLAASAVMSATFVLAVAPPASAEGTTAVTESEVTSDSATVTQAETSTSSSVQDAEIAAYTESQAAEGRMVDSARVNVAGVDGGIAVWESGSKVDQVSRARYLITDTSTGEQGEIEDLELIGVEDHTSPYYLDPGPEEPVLAGSGSGMTAARSMSGGALLAKYCQTWSHNGNKVTGCVEKMKPNNDYSKTRDYYAYNRWGTAEGKVIDWGIDWKVTKFDMRSRPNAAYPSYTKGMSDYFPNDRAELCSSSSTNLGVGSLSFTIGLTNCSEKSPIVNATTKTMGVIYDAGAVFEARVKGVDYEQEVWTYQGSSAPRLGLYNYGKFCRGTYATCSATVGKSGW